MIILSDIYEHLNRHKILYELLKEREPHQFISHRVMPSFEEHVKFIEERNPKLGPPMKAYKSWEFILKPPVPDGVCIVGSICVTNNSEVGIFIFKDYRGNGYGKDALKQVIERNKIGLEGKLIANISPQNTDSIRFFNKFGFKHIQNTYELLFL